jgi:hypothetical protein
MKCISRLCHQLKPERIRSLIAFALLTVTLVACGSSGQGDKDRDPIASTGTVVTPLIAQRGDTLTITGSKFGAAGSVLIGGTAARITSWSDTKITATISDGTPNGPQEVKLQKQSEAETIPGFFVGVAYGGAASGLQDFVSGLGKDTAVLLDAKTYALGTSGLELDRISLYGRGAGKTSLTTAAEPAALRLTAGNGETLVLADLSIATDSLLISNSLPAGSLTMQALNGSDEAGSQEASQEAGQEAGSNETASDAGTARAGQPDLHQAVNALRAARLHGSSGAGVSALPAGTDNAGASTPGTSPAGISPLALPETLAANVLLRNVTLSELTGGKLGTAQLAGQDWTLFNGSLQFEQVTVNAAKSGLVLFSSSDISFRGSRVNTGSLEILSLEGTSSMNATSFEANGHAAGLISETGLLLLSGADVTVTAGSKISSSGSIEIFSANLAEQAGPHAGSLTISESSLAAADEQGVIVIVTDNAALSIGQSRFETPGSLIIDVLGGDTSISGSTVTLGAAGNPAELFVQADGNINIEHNTITSSTALSSFGIDAYAQECRFSDNTFTVLAASEDSSATAQVWLSCSGQQDSPARATLERNTFDLSPAGSANFEFFLDQGSLTASGNTVSGTGILLYSSDPADEITFSDNRIDAAASEYGLALIAAGTATLHGNQVSSSSAEATALYVLTWDQLDLSASANTFTDFARALYFEDESTAGNARLSAAITGNEFLFDINEPPQVAWLERLAAGTEIDGSNNRWGAHTDYELLGNYVWQNDTSATIRLAPLMTP